MVRGNWSVRKLNRQIDSLYYERYGLSKDKKKLAVLAQEGAEAADPGWRYASHTSLNSWG